MLVAEEVVYQGRVLPIALGALAVGNTGRLDDARVASQVVHEADEALIEDGIGSIENFLGGRNDAMRH